VFRRGLKTNITINLAVLLVMAMIMIDFVIIITVQRVMLRSEISKGYLFISGLESSIANSKEPIKSIRDSNFRSLFVKLLNEAGYSCGVVLGPDENNTFFDGQDCVLQKELEILTRQSVLSGNKITGFDGTTWGVFWQQSRHLILAAPINMKESTGVGVALPLEKIYSSLRRIQYIVSFYIFINAVVLTLVGLYRLSRLTVKPLQRLVKRADEYQEDDEIFFLSEKEDNEFNKLSRSLNSMLTHIAADKEKLHMTVKSLEKVNLDLKQAQQDVIRAEKLASIGRLSSGIAHEIGNPIGIIVGYLELLKQDDISDEDRKEFIQRTESEIKRISTIIRQLLDLSRPSSGEPQKIAVHEIVNDIIDAFKFQPLKLKSNIDLQLDLKANTDIVIADPGQLRQVFLNLLINAADAIKSVEERAGGIITITSSIKPSPHADDDKIADTLKVEFIDNGPGIPEDKLSDIFDPFYTTKDPGEGTGLGLSVSFMIIEGIGGKITAASDGNMGTTITVFLPLA